MKKINLAYIISVTLVVLCMIIFELLYCNSLFMEQILFNVSNEATYNFSLFRTFIYIVVLAILIVFRKQLKDILIENQNIKIRKYIILIYAFIAMIGIGYVTIKLAQNQLKLPKIAVEYLTIILFDICLLYLSNNYIKNIIVIASTISLLFVITIDVNNTIDEKKHFMSAYCVSTGQFSYQDAKLDRAFMEMGHLIKYTNIEELFENNFEENLIEDYNKNDIPSTPADYNPILYVPSGIGIFIAKLLSNNMADIYFAGRIFNLISYVALIVMSLKILPYKKNTFAVIALMPMLFALGSVYTIDAVTMGLVSIFVAYCLRLKEKENINLKEILIILLLFVLLSLAKSMAYIFVAIIVFMLPLIKILKQNTKKIPYIIIAIVVALALVYILNSSKEISADPRGGDTNSIEQIKYMISNPIKTIKLGVNHIKLTLMNYNWLTGLNHKIYFSEMADYITLFILIFVLYVSVTDNSKTFNLKEKILFILAFFITYGVTSLILYITFTPVGRDQILGYQTRYIFPILPLLLMCISNNNIYLKNNINRELQITYISTFFIIISVIGSVLMG